CTLPGAAPSATAGAAAAPQKRGSGDYLVCSAASSDNSAPPTPRFKEPPPAQGGLEAEASSPSSPRRLPNSLRAGVVGQVRPPPVGVSVGSGQASPRLGTFGPAVKSFRQHQQQQQQQQQRLPCRALQPSAPTPSPRAVACAEVLQQNKDVLGATTKVFFQGEIVLQQSEDVLGATRKRSLQGEMGVTSQHAAVAAATSEAEAADRAVPVAVVQVAVTPVLTPRTLPASVVPVAVVQVAATPVVTPRTLPASVVAEVATLATAVRSGASPATTKPATTATTTTPTATPTTAVRSGAASVSAPWAVGGFWPAPSVSMRYASPKVELPSRSVFITSSGLDPTTAYLASGLNVPGAMSPPRSSFVCRSFEGGHKQVQAPASPTRAQVYRMVSAPASVPMGCSASLPQTWPLREVPSTPPAPVHHYVPPARSVLGVASPAADFRHCPMSPAPLTPRSLCPARTAVS
ncbi:unnamed protein product, partial [Polarella glacialis]